MKSRPSRLLAALFVTVLSLHVSGCFGSFALTRKIYGFNQGVSSSKFLQWALFLGFVIIPVYGVGAFIDAIVFNSLEFWTGNNPLASAETLPDGTRLVRLNSSDTLRLSRDEQSGVMRAELDREGQAPQVRYFEPLEDGMVVRDEAGSLLVRARERTDGALEVTDASGSTTVHSNEAMAQAREAFLRGGSAALTSLVTPPASSMQQGIALTCAAH